MSRIKKTNVNTSRPNLPVTKIAKKPSVSNVNLKFQPRSSDNNSYNGLDPLDFMAVHNQNYSISEAQDYSSNSYDSFGGGSSDGGGSSSDW